MSLEEDVVAYRQLCEQLRQLEEHKKTLSQKILDQMTTKKMAVAGCIAQRYNRLSIRIPLEQARALNATTFVEQVDRDKIKELYRLGTPLEAVKEYSYLVVSNGRETNDPEKEEI